MISILGPAAGHGHGILAHRNRDTERRAQIKRNGLHGLKKIRVLACLSCCRHPVRAQVDI